MTYCLEDNNPKIGIDLAKFLANLKAGARFAYLQKSIEQFRT